MESNRPYWKVMVSLVFSLLATALVIGIGIAGIRIFAPFVVGWIIACIANPVVCWLDKQLKIKRKLGSALMIVLVIGAVIALAYLVISMLVREIGGWIVSLPTVFRSMTVEMQELADNLSGIVKVLPQSVKDAGNGFVDNLGDVLGGLARSLSEPTMSFAGVVAKQIPSIVIGTFMVILSAYFFVADRESVLLWVKKVTPDAVYQRMAMAISYFKFAVGGYFIAQFKIMAVVSTILFVGLSLLKVEYAFVLAILIGLLDFLPFFGTGTAFVPWCIYTVLTGNYMRALILLIIYVTTQVVRQLIQPKLVGDEVGLKPLPTLLLIYVGYKLGGFLWMILAVPLGMILINMYKSGGFDYILDDVKILVKGIKSLRE